MATPFAVVITTCGGKPEAEAIAARLVEKRLAACVQIIPIASVYWWEGAVERADEFMLLCKIKTADYPSVEAEIGALHSYATPEIIAIGIEKGAPAYLDWIASVTGA
jgi:periplasmic divalent cation tolerance protein